MFDESYRSVWSSLMDTPFALGFVDAGGVRTRYLEAGRKDAPPLILLHGMNGSLECFCANIAVYAQHFRVVAFDAVGCGFSDRPDVPIYEISHYREQLENLMNALDIERASFVCVSMGSWIATALALAAPARVDRMVFCALAGRQRQASQNMQSLTDGVRSRSAASEFPTWENIYNVFAGIIHRREDILPDFVKVRQSVFQLPGAKAANARILGITPDDVYARNHVTDEDYRTITAPTLIIVSECDAERIKENSRIAADLMPNGRCLDMTQVSHWPQFEDSETFNRETLAFLLD
jgi:2-hydroxy-6-oxonona-2,4-dienedioate hydrolase